MAISRASMIVATPIVTASFGTNSSPKKSAAASRRVTTSRCTRRVLLSTPEPGSLNPMCPVLPTPRIWKSIPPAILILPSYSAHIASTWSRGTSPRGMFTFSGLMSTWEKKFSHMKRWYEWMVSGAIG
jgi:hypothetical protein